MRPDLFSAQGGVLPHIQNELLPKKTKADDEHGGPMESQRGNQGHPVMKSQTNKTSMAPMKKSMGPPMGQKKSAKPKPTQNGSQPKSSQSNQNGSQKANQKQNHDESDEDDVIEI